MRRRKKKRKYEHFVLNWKICCIEDFDAAVEIFENWAEAGEYTGENCTVKEIICSVDAELYERLSRGDKLFKQLDIVEHIRMCHYGDTS